MIHDFVESRAKEEAHYMIEANATLRNIAGQFFVSKSTVYKDLTERLKLVAPELNVKVNEILQSNKEQRHVRGGEATREKFEKLRTCRTGSRT